MPPRIFLGVLVGLVCGCAAVGAGEDEGSDVKAYWQGNQLNNQSRLGQPFEGFEVQGTNRRPEGREADKYLSSIRTQIAGSQTAGGKETVINFQARGFERALTISHAGSGDMILTLRLQLLFDENTGGLRLGAYEVLDRLAQVLSETPRRATQLILEDALDTLPEAKNIDAERAQFVLAYLSFLRHPETGPAGLE